jgi:hypothetical protein
VLAGLYCLARCSDTKDIIVWGFWVSSGCGVFLGGGYMNELEVELY